jgi:hypothetical protein
MTRPARRWQSFLARLWLFMLQFWEESGASKLWFLGDWPLFWRVSHRNWWIVIYVTIFEGVLHFIRQELFTSASAKLQKVRSCAIIGPCFLALPSPNLQVALLSSIYSVWCLSSVPFCVHLSCLPLECAEWAPVYIIWDMICIRPALPMPHPQTKNWVWSGTAPCGLISCPGQIIANSLLWVMFQEICGLRSSRWENRCGIEPWIGNHRKAPYLRAPRILDKHWGFIALGLHWVIIIQIISIYCGRSVWHF